MGELAVEHEHARPQGAEGRLGGVERARVADDLDVPVGRAQLSERSIAAGDQDSRPHRASV